MEKTPAGETLKAVYKTLYKSYGPQHWWPADSDFEVVVGAILTQSTSWRNVEKAILNLKAAGVLSPEGIRRIRTGRLARLIRPSLYHNMKARKLKAFMDFLYGGYGGVVGRMRSERLDVLRPKLLSVWGVGPETADSILLYALGKPSFVVDAYTIRIFSRLGLVEGGAGYEEVKRLFEGNLKRDARLYNEYHALIVELGKSICRKNMPSCGMCPLRGECGFIESGRIY